MTCLLLIALLALVADFGGLSAPEICFIRKGLQRDPQQGGETRKETSKSTGDGVAATITATYGTKWNGNAGAYNGENFVIKNAISFQERAGKPGGGKGILIQDEHTGALSTLNNQSVFCLQGNGIDRADTAGCNGKGWCEDVGYTLNTIDRPAVYSVSHDIRSAKLTEDEITDPLTATDYKDPPAVAYGLNRERCGAVVGEEVMPTLQTAAGESGNNKPMVFSAGFDGSMGANAGNIGYEEEKAPTLNAGKIMNALCVNNQQSVLCLNDQGGSVMNHSVDVAGALRAEEHGHQPIVYNGSQITSEINHSNPQPGDACHSLTTDSRNYVVEPIMVEMTSTKNTVVEDGVSPTLTARMGTGGNQVNALCMDVGFFQTSEEKVGALLARQYKDPPITYQDKTGSLLASGYEKNGTQEAANDMYITGNMVRRLTPLECERLQGFPDGWTDIGEWTDSKGKKHKPSDSPRYKALGNSIALPFWFYLLRRISAQYERPATLGSLFDGIGGFPLCWERCNGKGTALWASEIEEFPIAVTKLRFPENQ
jgi:site-specific DNA-cytosine methylase